MPKKFQGQNSGQIIEVETELEKKHYPLISLKVFEYSKKKQSSSSINSDTRKNNDGSKAVGKTRGEIVE